LLCLSDAAVVAAVVRKRSPLSEELAQQYRQQQKPQHQNAEQQRQHLTICTAIIINFNSVKSIDRTNSINSFNTDCMNNKQIIRTSASPLGQLEEEMDIIICRCQLRNHATECNSAARFVCYIGVCAATFSDKHVCRYIVLLAELKDVEWMTAIHEREPSCN
jgi:hypothetical protein